jgi:hypothetical protein
MIFIVSHEAAHSETDENNGIHVIVEELAEQSFERGKKDLSVRRP